MKRKTILAFAVVLALLCSAAALYIHKSYYPMGGKVTVVDKKMNGSAYYIVIEQRAPIGEERGSQFTLKCTLEQYEGVSVGDVINCERDQSVVTHRGVVHHIR